MRRARRWCPHLETLEGRDVPAVSAGLDPGDSGLLVVTGDAAANEVMICHSDAADWIQVASPKGLFPAQVFGSATVHTIRVELLGGDDWLRYALLDDLTTGKLLTFDGGADNDTADINTTDATIRSTLQVEVGQLAASNAGNDTIRLYFGHIDDSALYVTGHLGDGNDSFAASFCVAGSFDDAALTGNSLAFFDVRGGAGQDLIGFLGRRGYKTDLGTLYTGMRIGGLAEVHVDFDGETGDDRIIVDYLGQLDGFFEVDAHGSADDDQLEGDIKVTSGLTASQGEIDINFFGDRGDDHLGLLVDVPRSVQFTDGEVPFIDGGEGFDIVTEISAPVQEQNMEG